MGFFDFLDVVIDPLQSAAGRVLDVGTSGLLGPGVAALSGLAGGQGLTSTLAGLGGAQGPTGLAGEFATNVAAGQFGAGAAAAAGLAGASGQLSEIALTLARILSANGINSAPTGNIKATIVLTLTPQNLAFIDSVQRGTPAVMSRDMQITKKTIKRIQKMARRIPRKVVEPSLNSQINTQVKRKIMDDIGCSSPLRGLPPAGGHC